MQFEISRRVLMQFEIRLRDLMQLEVDWFRGKQFGKPSIRFNLEKSGLIVQLDLERLSARSVVHFPPKCRVWSFFSSRGKSEEKLVRVWGP